MNDLEKFTDLLGSLDIPCHWMRDEGDDGVTVWLDGDGLSDKLPAFIFSNEGDFITSTVIQ